MKLFSKAKYLLDGRKKGALIDFVWDEDVDYINTVDPKVQEERDYKGNTGLLIATKNGNLDLCQKILTVCPSLLYHENNKKKTVLHQATDPNNTGANFLFLDYFVTLGVIELEISKNKDVYMKFKRWMIKQDLNGDTALLIAAYNGNLHVVKRFIEVDRQYNLGLSKVVGSEGKTALNWAVDNEDLEMVKLLTDEGDPYSDFVPYSTAMDLFCRVRSGDSDYIKTVERNVLRNSRDKKGKSVLFIATECNQVECCKEILKRCPSLLYQYRRKWSVLHEAAHYKIYSLINFFLSAVKSEGGTESMIRFRKWVNLQNSSGETAFMLAVHSCSHDIVKKFLEVDRQYKFGLTEIVGADNYTTPLNWAIHTKEHEMIKTLSGRRDPNLYYGANSGDGNFLSIAKQQALESLQTGNSSGTGVSATPPATTSKHVCKDNYATVEKSTIMSSCIVVVAASTGLDQIATSNEGDTSTGDGALLKPGRHDNLGLSNLVKDKGKAAFDWPVENNEDHEMVKLFDRVGRGYIDYIKTVEVKVLLNSRDKDRNSVLCIATKYNRLDCCEEILKRCPSLLYHQNSDNWSVLHHAACQGIYRLIDFFVSAGLKATKCGGTENMIHFQKWINLQNRDGDTALILAVIIPNNDIVKRFAFIDHQYKLGLSEIVGKNKRTAWELAMLSEDNEMILKALKGKESLQTGNHSGTGVATESNIFTLAELTKHNNLKDRRLWINKKMIYDWTKFWRNHSGGSQVLLKASGKDATTNFKIAHSQSSNAVAMMDKTYVGVCDPITSLLSQLANVRPQLYSSVQLNEFTKDFSHPLGSGGFGDVYKGQFPDGKLIAVKKLRNSEHKENTKVMEEHFMAEVDTMSRANHHNLIKLHGYCYEANTKFKALVYDYMENGSFDKILFEKKLDIPWAKLHNIAKEIAQGISYLHEGCNPRIIHQDIKPANVLIDSNLSPKVIDFGLAKVINMGESQFEQTKIKGSRGYMAPEVNQQQKVKLSSKLDVYSFGMMLFDILGSKRNHVEKRWFPGQVWEMYKAGQLEKFILDCGIKEEDKNNAERLATIALLCVEHDPQNRPKLSNVVKMLEGEIIQLETPVVPFSRDYITESYSTSDTRDH